MTKTNTLVILDELLEKIDGHNFEYSKSVKEVFEKNGYKVIVYGNRNVIDTIRNAIGAIPWFHFNPKPFYRKIPILGAVLYRLYFWTLFRQQLKDCIAMQTTEAAETEIFIPNVYWYTLLPVSLAIRHIPFRTTILLRTSMTELLDVPPLFKPLVHQFCKMAQRISDHNKNIKLATDSEVIAEDWATHYGGRMKVLPIPHLEEAIHSNIVSAGQKIRLYAPGVMRMEKGIKLLTEGFEILDEKYPELASRLILITQFFGEKEKEELLIYKSRLEKLVHCTNEFGGSLSSEEYNHTIQQADIILLPYCVNRGYRARTSGVMCEAMNACKPFITTKNTWMEYQSTKYKTGLGVEDNHPEALADAVVEMVARLDEYKKAAEQAAPEFAKFHSKDNFVRIFNSQ